MYAKAGFTSETEEIKIKTSLSFIKKLFQQLHQPQNICAPYLLSHNLNIFNTQHFVPVLPHNIWAKSPIGLFGNLQYWILILYETAVVMCMAFPHTI